MRQLDKYSGFIELGERERAGADYRVRFRRGPSGISVMSLHGGNIEPGTSELADAVAAHEHTFYAFEGLKSCDNWDLHVASTRFDEPLAMIAARHSRTVVAIHGCLSRQQIVYLGGRDESLKRSLASALVHAGFCIGERAGLQGRSRQNICNLSGRGKGLQLEISSALRRAMFRNLTRRGRTQPTARFHRFVQVLRNVLQIDGAEPGMAGLLCRR